MAKSPESPGHFEDFSGIPAGARFLRADLHIHSYGVSQDVADKQMTVANIIATSKERNLDVIAIADHNAIDSVDELLKKAPAEGLVAFPGVELTTGEGHVLVYFPPNRLKEFKSWFARLEFKEDQSGDKHTLVPIHELLPQVEKAGGLAIPAHIGRDNTGFLDRVSPQIAEAIITSPALTAVEVDKASQASWYSASDASTGFQKRAELLKRRTAALGAPKGPRIAKLLFSDAHDLKFVGRDRDGKDRVTRIKMSEPSFDAFRTAIADPDARIKLEAELPASYPRIVGARFIGGFLDGQVVTFSPNLTCLIGGRGTGKSTIIESLRCACLSSKSRIEGQPNCPETVQLIYQDEYGHEHYLKRDAGKATYELTDDGAVEMSVPVEGYSQDRIAEIVRGYKDDPKLLLEFLDQFADMGAELEKLDELSGALRTNAEEIAPIQSSPTALEAEKKALAATKLKLKAIEGSNLKEALEWRRKLQRERQVREELEDRLRVLDEDIVSIDVGLNLDEMLEEAEIEELSKTPSAEILTGKDGKSGLSASIKKLDRDLASWKKAGPKKVALTKPKIEEALKAWREREQLIEGRVQKILAELREKGIKPDLAELNRLTKAESDSVRSIRQLKAQTGQLKKLRKERKELLEKYRGTQERRYQVRAQAMRSLTDQLNATFEEFRVKLGFNEGQFVGQYTEWIRQAVAGKFIRGHRITSLCLSVHPVELAELIRENNTRKLRALKDEAGSAYLANDEEVSGFMVALRDVGLDALEELAVDDYPEISLTTEINGKPTKIEFEHLSFGQQASILLGALLFSSEHTPLIIDQPEDHLDSQFISRTVVSVLRSIKERRQVIVATHNANITVLGDAEQIVPLQGYNGKGLVRDPGAVDALKTRSRVCEVLEGGEAAYTRRGEMYGLTVKK